MNNDKWRELKNLPVEKAMKDRIYANIVRAPRLEKQRLRLRELLIVCATVVLAVFLFALPQIQQHTASTEVAALYKYDNFSEKRFMVKPSELYTGVIKIEEKRVLELMASLESYVVPTEDSEASYWTEVLFIENGTEHRYKFGYDGFVDVDTGQQYIGNSFEYKELAAVLTTRRSSNFYLFLPMLLLINAGTALCYRYLKLVRPKFPYWYYAVQVVCVLGMVYVVQYRFEFELLWKPAVVALFFSFGVLQSGLLIWQLSNPVHRRIEIIAQWLLVLTVCYGFWTL